MFLPPWERGAVGGPSCRFGLPRRALPLGLHLSIHSCTSRVAGQPGGQDHRLWSLVDVFGPRPCPSLGLPLRAHLRPQLTSLFPFSHDPVEKADPAGKTRAALPPGWASTPTLWGRPLRKEASGGPCPEEQVAGDASGCPVWLGQCW